MKSLIRQDLWHFNGLAGLIATLNILARGVISNLVLPKYITSTLKPAHINNLTVELRLLYFCSTYTYLICAYIVLCFNLLLLVYFISFSHASICNQFIGNAVLLIIVFFPLGAIHRTETYVTRSRKHKHLLYLRILKLW